jgi:hypothetical protein
MTDKSDYIPARGNIYIYILFYCGTIEPPVRGYWGVLCKGPGGGGVAAASL